MARIILLFILGFYPSTFFSQVTYHEHIKPILNTHCTSCHSDGNVGPMVLDTYNDVASYASMIKFVTHNNYMPPFKADYNKVAYANERSLSKEELTLIEAWIQDGLLEGTTSQTGSLNKVVGEIPNMDYDTIVCMSEAFEHYGIYYDQYQAFVLPTDLTEDKKIKEIEFIPGNKEIVRSAYISIAQKDDAKLMDEWDPRYGYYSYGGLGFEASQAQWYSWMPNTPSLELKNNEHLFLPKNSELILQLHYGPFGEIQTDSSCIALKFEEENLESTQLQNIPLVSTHHLKDSFNLLKDEKKRFTSSFYIPADIKLKSITPLSHLLCKSWEVFAVLPDKSTIPLLSIDDWDFHWREKYLFEEYISLPKNTRIVSTAQYDNSLDNPYNPSDPPHTMKQGPHMYDENFLCYFEFLNELKDDQTILLKPYTLGNKKQNEIAFVNLNGANITITLHNLSDQTESVLTQGIYPKGNHQIISSDFPQATGRYAIVVSSEDKVHDVWFFVQQ